MHDELGDILRDTDEAMGSPGVDGRLVGKVRRRARNERVSRTVLTTCAFVVLGLLAIQFAPRSGNTPQVFTTKILPKAETPPNVDELVGEVLLKHQLQKESTKLAVGGDDYLWRLSQERDRAALILVRSGDRLCEQLHDRPAAEANYRLAIELFPNSPSAAVAQARLQGLERKGSSL
jgi:hypothetical protein